MLAQRASAPAEIRNRKSGPSSFVHWERDTGRDSTLVRASLPNATSISLRGPNPDPDARSKSRQQIFMRRAGEVQADVRKLTP